MTGTDGSRTQRIDLLAELVAINSVNPLQAGPRSGPGGEAAMAQWLADRADAMGAEVTVDEVIDGRSNVYAFFPGDESRMVAVDVHLDTVGVEHMTGDPFDADVRDGRVFGRGSVDTKATLAVILPLLEQVAAGAGKLRPHLYLIGTVGEEAGGLAGAHRVREWAESSGIHFDQILVAEPTLCAPVHGHSGGVGFEITVRGEAAHSSKPHLGRNAIVAAARIVTAFQREHELLAAGHAATSVGTGSLSVTEIAGGLARNIIPDECHLYAGRRIAPGEDPEAEFARLRAVAQQAADPLPVEVAMANGRCSAAFYEDPTSPLVRHLCDLAGEAPTTATYGSNALAYRPISEEIVVFGPGSIDQAHKAVEWIEISELDRAAAIYQRLLISP
jgi:acetylornithine deacetylase/succinyl-diaminopimelate desuccinylase-like protein